MTGITVRNWFHSDEYGMLVDLQLWHGEWAVELLPRHWKKLRKAVKEARLYDPKRSEEVILRHWSVRVGEWWKANLMDNRLVW